MEIILSAVLFAHLFTDNDYCFGELLRMIEKDFDSLFQQVTIKTCATRGYEWKVVVDPTREGHDPGMFFGRLFRIFDIRINRDEKSTWPEGIVFEHIKSGHRLTYQSGLLVDLTNSIVLKRKNRIRDRKRSRKTESIKKFNDNATYNEE